MAAAVAELVADHRLRFAYISSLRGIAALSVLGMHSMLLSDPAFLTGTILDPFITQGRMGVLLFFSLSAFTLALSFSRSNGNPLPFYLKRFFRIAPLFYPVTLFYLLWFGPQPIAHVLWPDLPATILRNVFFIFNFDISGGSVRGIATGAWTIGIEMPFYLAFPFLFRYASTLRRAAILFAASVVVSALFRWGLHFAAQYDVFSTLGIRPPDSLEEYAGQSLFANLPYFAIGFVVYHLVALAKPLTLDTKRASALLLLLVGGCGLLGTSVMTDSLMTSPFPIYHLNGVFCGMLLLGLALHPFRLLVNGLTKFYGDISYSLYLLHPAVIFVVRPYMAKIYGAAPFPLLGWFGCWMLVLAVTTALAYLTYRFIELPGINIGERLAKRFETTYVSRAAVLARFFGRKGAIAANDA